jgi:excisionase family DNA binding protein
MTEDDREGADPWLTLAEIAEELRVNPATVRQWVSKGQLKASRAGVRKWIVRRSDLDRMLARANPPATAPARAADAREAPPARAAKQLDFEANSADRTERMKKARAAIELARIANSSLNSALDDSRYALPSPGYLDRVRRIADACEHIAATLLNAGTIAGIHWTNPQRLSVETLPYELRPYGNRPGEEELWEEFDAAVERLVLVTTGTDVGAVAYAFREMGDALQVVADALEQDESWQEWEKQAG